MMNSPPDSPDAANIGRSISHKSGDVDAVKPISFHVSDIHDHEIRKLHKRKYAMHIIMALLAAYLIGWYCYFYTLACVNLEEYTSSKKG
mmetsp:Transcript_4690/g.5752  ORF Transcript_4690/g.5752 Transcript_4690/m.5752 type:complete len:89 (+) Transcript_4690:656-922(+)